MNDAHVGDRAAVVRSDAAAGGPVGAAFPSFGIAESLPVSVQRRAIGRLERAGYGATWTGEGVGGRDALVHAALLLAATERMVFGTAVANMWARAPEHLHAGAAQLAEAHTDEELDGGADRVVDDVVGYGDPAAIAAKVREHLTAGADHVVITAVVADFERAVSELELLGPALTTITGEAH